MKKIIYFTEQFNLNWLIIFYYYLEQLIAGFSNFIKLLNQSNYRFNFDTILLLNINLLDIHKWLFIWKTNMNKSCN